MRERVVRTRHVVDNADLHCTARHASWCTLGSGVEPEHFWVFVRRVSRELEQQLGPLSAGAVHTSRVLTETGLLELAMATSAMEKAKHKA